jgi:hypothetical protein
VLSQENAFYADGSQLAADDVKFTKPGASVWQLFANEVDSPENVGVRLPGQNADGSSALAPLSILGDRDADGVASCRTVGGQCVTDPGDLEAACGFPEPFPACRAEQPIVVSGNADCTGAPDAKPGNGRCDLAPGTYGALDVQDQGKMTLGAGTYVFCAINIGRSANVITTGPAVLLIGGDFLMSNASSLGQQCGDLTLLAKGAGSIGFGRNSYVAGLFCGPERHLQLGHDNDLRGRFVALDVDADSNDRGYCCAWDEDCACIDGFSPTGASVGATVTLRSACPLGVATEVRICGIVAPIVSRTENEVRVAVPGGAAGACAIDVQSPSGVFHARDTLAVS